MGLLQGLAMASLLQARPPAGDIPRSLLPAPHVGFGNESVPPPYQGNVLIKKRPSGKLDLLKVCLLKLFFTPHVVIKLVLDMGCVFLA